MCVKGWMWKYKARWVVLEWLENIYNMRASPFTIPQRIKALKDSRSQHLQTNCHNRGQGHVLIFHDVTYLWIKLSVSCRAVGLQRRKLWLKYKNEFSTTWSGKVFISLLLTWKPNTHIWANHDTTLPATTTHMWFHLILGVGHWTIWYTASIFT